MLKQQLHHCHSHSHSRQPLFTWRTFQTWCLGKRASGYCKLFIRLRTRPRLRLASLLPRCKPHAFFLAWLAYRTKQRKALACSCLPINIKQAELHEQCRSPHARAADMHAKSQKAFKRISESHAETGNQQIFSTQLGISDPSSIMECLQGRSFARGEASCDSLSAPSSSAYSLSSSSRSSSSSGSFHRVSGSSRVREACAKVVSGGPAAICELVAGNQFLVHLSAAPLNPTRSFNGGLVSTEKQTSLPLNPSMGIVTNSTLKHKDSDLNDRLVFFK